MTAKDALDLRKPAHRDVLSLARCIALPRKAQRLCGCAEIQFTIQFHPRMDRQINQSVERDECAEIL